MTEEDPMINWKQKMMKHCDHDWERKLLREGATSSATGMGLMALKYRYKKIMGIDTRTTGTRGVDAPLF